jgi:hypothetical protein
LGPLDRTPRTTIDIAAEHGYLTVPLTRLVGPESEHRMASNTEISEAKRTRRHKNAGHQRKLKQARRSTASYTELFAACGQPGEPAPKPKQG